MVLSEITLKTESNQNGSIIFYVMCDIQCDTMPHISYSVTIVI